MTHSIKDAHLDPELALYVAEVQVALQHVQDSRQQLSILWENGRSDTAKLLKNSLGLEDSAILHALLSTCVVGMSMVLDDNQSKCLATLVGRFPDSPLKPVIDVLFTPLWERYICVNSQEMTRLRVNRNNMFAHISRERPQADILGYSEEVISRLKPLLDEETELKMREAPYSVIEYSDVLGNSSLFSDQSFGYLSGLMSILSFAQIEEVLESMTAYADKHINDFHAQHNIGI